MFGFLKKKKEVQSEVVVPQEEITQEEVKLVKLEIEVSEQFLNVLNLGKADIEKQFSQKLEMGEYIEGAMNDMVRMIDELSKTLQQISEEGYIPNEIDKKDPMYG